MESRQNTLVTTVAFVGQPNVGKSTLLNAMVGTKIAPTSRKPQTTRRIVRGIKTIGHCQQIYFDTPGVLRNVSNLDQFMRKQISLALADVEQVVAIVDAADPVRYHVPSLKSIRKACSDAKQNFIVVINKIDVIKNKALLLELVAQYAKELDVDEIIPISALTHDGISHLFDAITKHAKSGPFWFSEDLFTDASEKEIVAELIREKAMLELNEELPYRLAVTIENFDESRREDEKKPLVAIDAVMHVERQSQKAIVIGKGGAAIRTIGTRARKDIEHLLQCQVMLKLFVRVEPNWTQSPKAMKKLGF